MLATLIGLSTILFGLACFLFILSIVIGRNDIADIAWGPGIALAGWSAGVLSPLTPGWPYVLLTTLITIWAVRLSIRIYLKNRRQPEDPRYAHWRASWGHWFYLRSFFQVYLLQCALMLVLALSAVTASLAPAAAFSTPYIIGGTIIWLIGFLFEAIADHQLDRHIKNPKNKGKLMRSGLWRYSRHPNYFGEITMWWGLWFMTLALPLWYVALLSPITITILIRYVSGVPMLEPLMEKYAGWQEYKVRTNMLIPSWPKRD